MPNEISRPAPRRHFCRSFDLIISTINVPQDMGALLETLAPQGKLPAVDAVLTQMGIPAPGLIFGRRSVAGEQAWADSRLGREWESAQALPQMPPPSSVRGVVPSLFVNLRRTMTPLFQLLLGFLLLAVDLTAADTNRPSTRVGIEFARIGERSLKLDLHLPPNPVRTPIIVWVHGGAWRSGSRESMPLGRLVAAGYAVASVDYRLSTEARFPAQIHDIKAAIRFLRGQGGRWNLPTNQIAVAGDSAGGHLAALVGVSNGHPELEGAVGNWTNVSSSVQGIVSFYGGANLTTILKQSTPHGLGVRVPALDLLLGGQPESVPELARLASPVFHVDPHDPPLLLLHGDQDPQMPINQAHELMGAYRKLKLQAQLEVVHGAGHGGAVFYDEERTGIVRQFLDRQFTQ